jgi:D-sedoheptulose 7-phosphate isomerase
MREEICRQLTDHRKVIELLELQLSDKIEKSVDLLVTTLNQGHKVLIMGNGGSAADSQHFAAEVVGRFKMERRGLPAIALTTDSSILTALGNDYGYDLVFRRQVEALAQKGDLVIGISTSGTSKNIYLALELAKESGCSTIGLLGKDGGTIRELVDIALVIPSDDTPRIQEGHLTIIHILCDLLEKKIFGS